MLLRKKPRTGHEYARSDSFETMEARVLLSVAVASQAPHGHAQPNYLVYQPAGTRAPRSTSSPRGLTPAKVRHAYGIDNVHFGSVTGDGSGQTIAIIDAYDSPTISHDLAAFDSVFGLPAPPSFRRVAQDGTTHYPGIDPNRGNGNTWEGETALDVEWAHAIAPKANILLVEARSGADIDLLAAVDYARRQAGVSVVSMSFGGPEDSSQLSKDSIFTTPSGHGGVAFFAATGDLGSGAEWPASSPNVVAVGGTTLSISSAGSYLSEKGWGSGSSSSYLGGGGGGLSSVEAQPSYQHGVVTQSTTHRATPDVAFDADPASGVAVYDSFDNGTVNPWDSVGGTSLSTPAWAAMTAIANQGRAVSGRASMDGRTTLLPLLYTTSGSKFHDITTGNNGNSAGTGYDLVTGRGTPRADLLLPAWASASTPALSPTPTPAPTPTHPSNDNFASAKLLSGSSLKVTGTNAGATRQSGEPLHGGNPGGASVWYKWTAPTSGTVTLSLAGSSFDTTLGVYTGSAVNSLHTVASNDDDKASLNIFTSKATFVAAAGTTYFVAVDGYNGGQGAATGSIALSLTLAATVRPSNDNFASGTWLSGSAVSVTGSNVNATRESGEPTVASNPGGRSIWYNWTAGATGKATISLAGSSFDTTLGVLTGSALSGLALVGANDDASYTAGTVTSLLTFNAVKGVTYHIDVDGFNNGSGAPSGTVKLSLKLI